METHTESADQNVFLTMTVIKIKFVLGINALTRVLEYVAKMRNVRCSTTFPLAPVYKVSLETAFQYAGK